MSPALTTAPKADTSEGTGRRIGAGGSTLVLLIASVWAIVPYS